MHMQDKVGSLQVGKQFDCLIIDCGAFTLEQTPGSQNLPFDIFPDDTNLDRLEKFIQLGDDRNIRRVYVSGKQILK